MSNGSGRIILGESRAMSNRKAFLGAAGTLGSDAYCAFYDPNTGYNEAVDLGQGVTDPGPYGFSATGNFDPSTNVVNVTVVSN